MIQRLDVQMGWLLYRVWFFCFGIVDGRRRGCSGTTDVDLGLRLITNGLIICGCSLGTGADFASFDLESAVEVDFLVELLRIGAVFGALNLGCFCFCVYTNDWTQ